MHTPAEPSTLNIGLIVGRLPDKLPAHVWMYLERRAARTMWSVARHSPSSDQMIADLEAHGLTPGIIYEPRKTPSSELPMAWGLVYTPKANQRMAKECHEAIYIGPCPPTPANAKRINAFIQANKPLTIISI